jgi:flagellar basal-body rod protein FlgG
MQAIYTAKQGLRAQQQRIDIIASNMANVSTTGYKSQRAGFKDALYTEMIDPSDTESTANLMQGSGVLTASTYRDFTTGTPMQTGETLDFYLDGDGFFTVQNSAGDILYTRCGAFAVSAENDGRYLVTADGYYVLDDNGDRIELPAGSESVTVTSDGILDFGGGATATLGLATFVNKDGLSLIGNGCYTATDASGEAIESTASVQQGFLESSNVDVSLELTNMIRTQRAYSMAGRVLSTWDTMASETNNIR